MLVDGSVDNVENNNLLRDVLFLEQCLLSTYGHFFFQEVSDLNDRELKALLDEAMNYKNPKDREGKSELFNVRNIISNSEQVPKTLNF